MTTMYSVLSIAIIKQQQQQQQSQTTPKQTSTQQEQAPSLNSENKASNVEHIKNQLINFGAHEKATHIDVREELKQQKSTSQQQQQQLHQQQQQQQLQHSQSNATEMRVSPKTNCFNLSGASAQSDTALASTDDNTISGGNNHQQQLTGNCPPTTPLAAISTATSPLIENGTTTAYMQEKYLPSSTTSPSDLRKEFDAKVNGEYFGFYRLRCSVWHLYLGGGEVVRDGPFVCCASCTTKVLHIFE